MSGRRPRWLAVMEGKNVGNLTTLQPENRRNACLGTLDVMPWEASTSRIHLRSDHPLSLLSSLHPRQPRRYLNDLFRSVCVGLVASQTGTDVGYANQGAYFFIFIFFCVAVMIVCLFFFPCNSAGLPFCLEQRPRRMGHSPASRVFPERFC